MTTIPPDDAAEQDRPSLQGDAPLQDPTVEELQARFEHRRSAVHVRDEPQGFFTLTFHYVTNTERVTLLRAYRRVRKRLPAALEYRMRQHKEIRNRGGGRKSITTNPNFVRALVTRVREHINEYDRDPGPSTAAGNVGASYWQLNRWLKVHRLDWPDIVAAAYFANPRKGAAYLGALEQKRRQQSV